MTELDIYSKKLEASSEEISLLPSIRENHYEFRMN